MAGFDAPEGKGHGGRTRDPLVHVLSLCKQGHLFWGRLIGMFAHAVRPWEARAGQGTAWTGREV